MHALAVAIKIEATGRLPALSLACQFSSTCTASCRLPPSDGVGSPRLCAHRSAALDPLDRVPSVTTPFHRQHDHAAGGISTMPELPALECSRSSGGSRRGDLPVTDAIT
jgi:hypothetical protein